MKDKGGGNNRNKRGKWYPPYLKKLESGRRKNGAVIPSQNYRFSTFLKYEKNFYIIAKSEKNTKGADFMPRPAKSAKLQLLEGNPNKNSKKELQKRAEIEERLHMKTDKIRPPTWLDSKGKRAFKFLAFELMQIELITNGDVYPLAMYCYWYSEHMRLQEQSKELCDEIGNPLIKQLDTCSRNMRAFGADLGLSPSARAKLAIKMAEEDDPEDEY
ncbi:MAG: phage terminase small subunit P27 family [Streptococcaceae bacterium]|jgi:P27 family predicted phage terminase small subunit|nr:phage terminase small subunit P27 family [Streptococcaceae bacterium]